VAARATSFGQCLYTFPAYAPVDLALAAGVARLPVQRRPALASVAVSVARVVAEDRPIVAAVGHAGASVKAAADTLALTLAALSQTVDVERYRVGPAVGAHTGPVCFGAFWWPSR
jgi:fatty acid-binding protein DegV